MYHYHQSNEHISPSIQTKNVCMKISQKILEIHQANLQFMFYQRIQVCHDNKHKIIQLT